MTAGKEMGVEPSSIVARIAFEDDGAYSEPPVVFAKHAEK